MVLVIGRDEPKSPNEGNIYIYTMVYKRYILPIL